MSFEFAQGNELEAVTALAEDEADSDFDARQRVADIASNKAAVEKWAGKGLSIRRSFGCTRRT